jgi:hypothetical protein
MSLYNNGRVRGHNTGNPEYSHFNNSLLYHPSQNQLNIININEVSIHMTGYTLEDL